MRDRREFLQPRLLREADDAEVRLVHTQQQRRLRSDRALVIGGAGAVRRSHLAQASAGACEHVRDPEAVADLDQLAAGNEHLAAFGECRQREHHRRRVVVDDERGLGTGQPPQDRRHVILPRATCAGAEVVLEIRVAPRRLAHTRERFLCERRASQIRVDDHAGGVDDAPQSWCSGRRELVLQARYEIPRISSGLYFFTRARENTARGLDGERIVASARQLVHRRQVAKLHAGKATARRP